MKRGKSEDRAMAFIPCGLGGISLLPAYSPWQPEAQARQTAPLPLPSPSPGRAPAPLSPQATNARGIVSHIAADGTDSEGFPLEER